MFLVNVEIATLERAIELCREEANVLARQIEEAQSKCEEVRREGERLVENADWAVDEARKWLENRQEKKEWHEHLLEKAANQIDHWQSEQKRLDARIKELIRCIDAANESLMRIYSNYDDPLARNAAAGIQDDIKRYKDELREANADFKQAGVNEEQAWKEYRKQESAIQDCDKEIGSAKHSLQERQHDAEIARQKSAEMSAEAERELLRAREKLEEACRERERAERNLQEAIRILDEYNRYG